MSKTRANREGNIRQRADGRWEVRITLGIDFATGEPKRISKYASTQVEAVKLLHQLSFLRDTVPNRFQNITLGEWLDMCLEVYMKNTIKQSTYNSYESYIRVHLKPALGNLDLQDITPRLLQQYYNYKAEKEGLAPKTLVNINLFLHKSLSYAVAEGHISSNPAEAINLSRGQKPQIEILTRDEQAQLVSASYKHRYGVFVRLTLFTGLRLGELLGLRWEDIDTKACLLHVRRTLNRLNKKERPQSPGEATTEIVIQTPKSENSFRSIPLLPTVMQELIAWKMSQANDRFVAGENYNDSGMLVTNPYGGYIEPRTFKDYYNQILELAGMRHFTFHALRHTFASRAMEQGMDPKTLSVILGHYSVSFTLDTYAHVLIDHKREGMALMEDLYNMQPNNDQPTSYPIIITTQEDGELFFTAPDFPAISFTGLDMQGGIVYMKERIEEELLTAAIPPLSTPITLLQTASNQMIFHVGI
ncbi:MAG: site-specific integrase [Clostridia bacterium]|nr:site-specific integrase [Clostridia bacterium]